MAKYRPKRKTNAQGAVETISFPIDSVDGLQTELNSKYEKPSSGIPKTDLASAVQTSLNNADKALPKTTYEYNKELSFGSTGKLCIGRFPSYDTNITVEINATTSTTYHGILVIATQNISTSLGGSISATVYGDATNTIAPNIYIEYNNGSNVISVYFSPASWSKNLIHIQAVNLKGTPTDVVTKIDAIPSTATRKPTNGLTAKFAPLASPTFTGTPKAPTAAKGTNTTQIATTAFVNSQGFTTADDIPTKLPNPKSLVIGDSGKSYDGSAEVKITAGDLGLTGVLRFIGTTTTALADGSTTNPITIGGKAVTAVSADVVRYGGKEFVWVENKWEELGDESSHALKTISITAGAGLTGGGTLESNRTISHADTSKQANITPTARTYVSGVTLDDFGHVTGLSTGTETVQPYTLPVATETALGGVKSGTDIIVDANGNVQVKDDSHNHTIANVDGLQNALNAKAPLASPDFSGTPTIGSKQIATQEFVTSRGYITSSGSITGNAATATKATNADVAAKLGTATKGSATKPIYLNAGTPTECGFTVADRSGSTKNSLDWTETDKTTKVVPTYNTIAYWNGAYDDNNHSNLQYCAQGAFGSAAIKGVTTTVDTSANLPTSKAVHDAIADNVTFVKNNSVNVAGTSKTTYKYGQTTIFSPNGLIMGGTAAAAGLVTRGICGVTTPDGNTGACTKENLYLNYDGNNTNNPNGRGVVINAGGAGENLGNGVYSYCAVRGDAMKAWFNANGVVISKVDLAFAQSKGTTPPTSWLATQPAPIAGQYLHYKLTITLSNGSSSSEYWYVRNSTDGKDGVSITSITVVSA